MPIILRPNFTKSVRTLICFIQCEQGAPVPVDMRLRVLQVNLNFCKFHLNLYKGVIYLVGGYMYELDKMHLSSFHCTLK